MGHTFSSLKTKKQQNFQSCIWKLTRLSSFQETKSLASHPLRKNPQSLIGQKEKERENKNIQEKQSKCSVDIFLPFKTVQRMRLPPLSFKENCKLYIRGYSPYVIA